MSLKKDLKPPLPASVPSVPSVPGSGIRSSYPPSVSYPGVREVRLDAGGGASGRSTCTQINSR